MMGMEEMQLRPELMRHVRTVDPYVPGEQPQTKVIKLNTNENPYPPAPQVARALQEMDADKLRLYPDPTAEELTGVLADYYGVKKNQVFVGVGSDDVLSMCFLTFFNSDKPILFPDVTYSFYKVWAELYRIPYECPRLDVGFRLMKEDYYKENGGIIFPNPNAPTAIYEELDFVEDIVAHNRDVVVIVDEAYVDFAGRSAIALTAKYDNLLVVQTFSKSRSMAGMRIGFCIGHPALIRCLNDVKFSFNSYTMSQAALACGVEAVKAERYFRETVRKIIDTREWAKRELSQLGFEWTDSRTNFLFVRHPEKDAGELFELLKKERIYVRYFGGGRTSQYLRITIGTQEEMGLLFAALKRIIQDR